MMLGGSHVARALDVILGGVVVEAVAEKVDDDAHQTTAFAAVAVAAAGRVDERRADLYPQSCCL